MSQYAPRAGGATTLRVAHSATWKPFTKNMEGVGVCLDVPAGNARRFCGTDDLWVYFSSNKSTVEPTTTRVLLVRNAMSSVSTVSAVPLRQW